MDDLSQVKVIQEIKRLDRLEVSLEADYIAKVDPTLYWAAKAYFPDWKDALTAAGITYQNGPGMNN